MRILTLVLGVFIIAGCQSAEKFEAKTCHYDGAYQQGANDGKQSADLRGEELAYKCPENTRADVRRGYREGYESFSKKNRSFVDILKDKVEGSGKPQTCKENKAGEEICGYGCIETNGEVKCAKKSEHACMSSGGKIHCGLNCRESRPGKVTCDEREVL
jgi:hypothetical protein